MSSRTNSDRQTVCCRHRVFGVSTGPYLCCTTVSRYIIVSLRCNRHYGLFLRSYPHVWRISGWWHTNIWSVLYLTTINHGVVSFFITFGKVNDTTSSDEFSCHPLCLTIVNLCVWGMIELRSFVTEGVTPCVFLEHVHCVTVDVISCSHPPCQGTSSRVSIRYSTQRMLRFCSEDAEKNGEMTTLQIIFCILSRKHLNIDSTEKVVSFFEVELKKPWNLIVHKS